jgi:uncharacterized phiE125 gp8 family phage protein
MAVTNGYSTLQELKNYLKITSSDATDDAVIEDCIEAASRYIDSESRRTFYSRTTETRYFDIPEDGERVLLFDDDLQSVGTNGFLNGDGTAFATTDYHLLPKNGSPHYGLMLNQARAKWWAADSYGNTEGVIAITGTWGYAATAPDDIKQACQIIAAGMYRQRSGQNESAAVQITPGGDLQPAAYVPDRARRIVQAYKRRL